MKSKNIIYTALIIVLNIGLIQAQSALNSVTTLSGTLNEFPYKSIKDVSGNIYICGYTSSSTLDFDMGAGTTSITSATTGFDGFVVKYSSTGTYLWHIHLNGGTSSVVYSMELDNSDNIYIVGTINGTVDMNPGAGTNNLSSGGGTTSFLAKYDSNGNYQWAQKSTGTGNIYYTDLAIINNSTIYIAGHYSGTGCDFDPGAGTASLSSNASSNDMFVAAYNTSDGLYANILLNFSSSNDERSFAIAADQNNNLLIGGIFNGTLDFDPGVNTKSMTSTSDNNGYLVSLNSTGAINWVALTSSTFEIEVDANNAIYTLNRKGLKKYSNQGDSTTAWFIDYGTNISNTLLVGSINFDASNNVYLGTCGGAILNGLPDNSFSISGSFYAKYTSAGELLYYKKFGSGVGVTAAYALNSGNVVVLGYISTANDLDTRSTVTNTITPLQEDIYFATFGGCGGQNTTGTLQLCEGQSITINGSTYVAQNFQIIVNNSYALDSPHILNQMYTSQTGCDSMVAITMTAQSFTLSVTASPSSGLTATMNGVSYQWLDCLNNYQVISGATSKTYAPTANGFYAVKLSGNGCVDTSNCYTAAIPTDVMNAFENEALAVYPNPNSEHSLHVVMQSNEEAQWSIYTVQGILVLQNSGKIETIAIDQLQKGTYLLVVRQENKVFSKLFERQ